MKIAIIGGGIIGLYLGWKLSEKGQEVTIFEKRPKIGKEVCSGLFSRRLLDFIPQSKNLIENRIDYCQINFPKKSVKIKFSKQFLVMSHYELDNLVANLARRVGVKIELSHEIDEKNLILLRGSFNKIVGCDGADSLIRKEFGGKKPGIRLAIQGFVPNKGSSDYVETWATKNGFIWQVPRKKDVEYGILEIPRKAKKIFETFLNEKNIKLGSMKSALVPQGLAIPKNEKITLCGDAAGLTKPWSGGGVIWGLTAAQILLQNFPDFLKYRARVNEFFVPRIILSKIATKAAYFIGFNLPWLLPGRVTIESDFLR